LVALRPHQPGARGGFTCGLPTAREPGDLAVRSVILGMIGAVLRMLPKSENQLFSAIYENILQCLLACFRQMLLVAQAACRRSGDCTRKSSGWAVDRPAPSIHAGRPLCTDVQIAKSGEPHRLPVTEDLIRSLYATDWIRRRGRDPIGSLTCDARRPGNRPKVKTSK
jgi:hypothetical protein